MSSAVKTLFVWGIKLLKIEIAMIVPSLNVIAQRAIECDVIAEYHS